MLQTEDTSDLLHFLHPDRFIVHKYDRKLKAGEVQSMAFTSSDPPPFYALEAPREDTDTGVTRKPKIAKAVAVGHVAALIWQHASQVKQWPEEARPSRRKYLLLRR
jgi:hypothetical protein